MNNQPSEKIMEVALNLFNLCKEEIEKLPIEYQKLYVIAAMCDYGENFAKALAKALAWADPTNARKIKQAFPEEWNTHLNIWIQKELAKQFDTLDEFKAAIKEINETKSLPLKLY